MFCILIYRYANEARIMRNGPLPHHADAFLTKCLDQHFGPNKKLNFWYVDKKRRALVTITSKVVDRLLKDKSKLCFMTT